MSPSGVNIKTASDDAALRPTPAELPAIDAYLRSLYTGVFSPEAFKSHVEAHVGFAFAEYALEVVALAQPKGARILDVGSGFGSFVLAARLAGYDAVGIEISAFEVEFARTRLLRAMPDQSPTDVYLQGDATLAPLPPESLDAVTFWNVLEHIDRYEAALAAAYRMLRPGGSLYVICPNYLAWRLEAHYHVPWTPWMALGPRGRVSAYLRSLGKDPRYFEESVFCRTNRGVMQALRSLGMDIYDLTNRTRMSKSWSAAWQALRRPGNLWQFHNPLRASVELAARKPA